MADDLARLLGRSRVAVFPDEPRFRLDSRVLLDLREFEGAPGESVRLRARWTVASGGDERALMVEEAHVVEPTASASFVDLVAAQRAALASLSQAIAGGLAVLTRPGRWREMTGREAPAGLPVWRRRNSP